ncbi:MAG: hypothetical protein OXM01_07865 [Gemmatimonadota bacterium]|nr:hypothetical protein [Gemmatimonadota bacterium]
MKRYTALVACLCLVLQPVMALAETEPAPITGADTRLYLADGSLVEGNLIEKAQDLVIMRVNDKIFTFDKTEIDKIITLESLGGGAQTISVTEFPYISFLGGALAFSLLSWLQFDRASDNEAEAALNREHGQLARAQKLDDKADRARLYGWSTAALAVSSFGVALIPRKSTRRIFPELSFRNGEPRVGVSYVYSF